jgi:diguanylate cyclase (GGDEF)-like protein
LRFFLSILAVLAALVFVEKASAQTEQPPVFDVSGLTADQDLLGFKGTLAAARQQILVEVPGADGKPVALTLDGKGSGTEFTWFLYSLKNTAKEPRDIVFAIPQNRFTSSGAINIAPSGSLVTQLISSNPDVVFAPMVSDGMDAVSLRLLPSQSVTVAVEGAPDTATASVWDSRAFDSASAQRAGVTGAILGVMGLVLLTALATISLRPHLATVAGACFAAAALIFIFVESGYVSRLLTLTSPAQRSLWACSETLLVIASCFCLYAFSSIRKVNTAYGISVLIMMGLGLANLALAAVEPERALTLARFGFVFAIIAGLPIALAGRRLGSQAVEGSVMFWCILAAWALMASILAVVQTQDVRLDTLLFAGLSCVGIAAAFLLVRFAFGEGYLAKPHMTDQVRRSLALAGARHYLWDWTPAESDIEYDEDFDTILGYRPGMLEEGGQDLFVELLHPEDRLEFLSHADAIASSASKAIEQDLRLKTAEGYYHWFALRARVLQGKGTAELRCIGTLTDVTKSKLLEERLLTDSIHDPLTGLPSRAIFMDRLERSASSNNAPPVHVLLIDLDRFKIMNDGLGHDIGDQLLQVVGQRIRDVAGETASVARMSGSQFAVMVNAVGKSDAVSIAGSVGVTIAEPIEADGRQMHLTASIGVSARSAYGVKANELLTQATSALHAARVKGPGTVMLFDSSMRDDRAVEVALESDLRRAIGRAEIEVHYQPIMQLTTLDIVGFEALARWRHPQLGLVAPESFIGAAERAGLIAELGQFVLSETARQLGQWQRTLFRNRPVFVAVNVSAAQFLAEDFVTQVQNILAREQLQPGSLKLEVTESVIVRYPERVERLFAYLRGLGVGFSCDDFGAGFSSLASLRDLHFDTLKMDRSFIAGEALDARSALIVSSVVTMARGLGMLVVAEGVENQNQIEQLARLGCELGQGFFLGVPVSAAELERLLAPPSPDTTAAQVFASTVLARADISTVPPPGLAPPAPRVAAEPPAPPPPAVKPQRLPSIFELGKGVPPKKSSRKKRKKKSDETEQSETQA